MIYVASFNRPAHEILAPRLIDLGTAYEREFVGMTNEPVDLDTLLETRKKLVADVKSRLTGSAAEFLRTLQAGEPDFETIGLPNAANLPAVRWNKNPYPVVFAPAFNDTMMAATIPKRLAAQRMLSSMLWCLAVDERVV